MALAALIVASAFSPSYAFDRDDEFDQGVTAFQSRDYESAWFHFWGLARMGDREAQFNLGQMYRRGEGVPRDLVQARRWYEAAAAQGFDEAQYQLGVVWETGNGVPADLMEARQWYARAARAGHERAQEALNRVETALAGGRTRTIIETPDAPPAATVRPNPPATPRRQN